MKAIKDYKFGVLAVLPFLALAVMVPQAQAKNTLSCTVVDEAGNPLDKQELRVTLTQTGKEWKRRTNKNGEVQFKGLNDGTYKIEGHELQNYFAKQTAPVELSGDVTHPCNLTFASGNYLDQLVREGIQTGQQGKYDLAIEKGNEVLTFSSDVAQARGHYVVSVGYAVKGMTDEALEAINAAAEIEPETFQNTVTQIHVMALGALANQAEKKRDFDAAISKYEEILAVLPNDPNAYYNMAVAYGQKKDFPQALEYIDKSIAANPADVEARQMKIRLQDEYLKSTEELKLQ